MTKIKTEYILKYLDEALIESELKPLEEKIKAFPYWHVKDFGKYHGTKTAKGEVIVDKYGYQSKVLNSTINGLIAMLEMMGVEELEFDNTRPTPVYNDEVKDIWRDRFGSQFHIILVQTLYDILMMMGVIGFERNRKYKGRKNNQHFETQTKKLLSIMKQSIEEHNKKNKK